MGRYDSVDISLDAMRQLFGAAFEAFCAAEADNIRTGTSERNLCQRLSLALERRAHAAGLHQYRADCEYNRANNGRLKTIVGPDMAIVTITCDLILHSRGADPSRDNLIAIEMKRANHLLAEKEKDRNRLMALTREPYDGVWSDDGHTLPEGICDYVVGYFAELDLRQGRFVVEEYVRGARTMSFAIPFDGRRSRKAYLRRR